MGVRSSSARSRLRVACVASCLSPLVVLAAASGAATAATQRSAATGPPGSAAAGPHGGARVGIYEPPTRAVVTDPFRPPLTPYGPGNRGIDYGTAPGDLIRAAGDGTVVFSGQVGGTLHVTIAHPDGLRTSYSFLAADLVRTNQRVQRGQVIAVAGGTFHFGVRDQANRYLDPASLFSQQLTAEVHLVEGPEETGQRAAGEDLEALRQAVRDRLATSASFGGRLASRTADAWRLRLQALVSTTSMSHLEAVARSLRAWHLQRSACTQPSLRAPKIGGRRIAVLVGGLGSTAESAAIDDVDVTTIGYAPEDVIRFSYSGGRTPKALPAGSSLVAIPDSTYSARDTQGDLNVSAGRLAQLLAQVAALNPGVPIDVIAHSQGGVISRLAVSDRAVPAEVANVVTLGTPHNGANLATAVAAARADPRSAAALQAAAGAEGIGLDPDSESVAQLAEGSATMRAMNAASVPSSISITSIGARGDLVVPAPRTLVGDGSKTTVVPLDGIDAHDRLPGSAAASREIALAVAGQPPTCRSFGQALTDAMAAEAVDILEDDLTAAAAWAPVAAGP